MHNLHCIGAEGNFRISQDIEKIKPILSHCYLEEKKTCCSLFDWNPEGTYLGEEGK